jgi:hypothetical protein
MAQAGPGKIRLFNDFCGPEIPVANAVAYGTSAGGCNYYLGDFAVKGDLADTDAGVVALGIASGAVRVTGTNEDKPLVDSNATTHTLTATDIVGFNFNSIYTGASLFWHTVYNGGTTTGPTATSSTVTDVVPVAGEWQILRIQIDINGTVRWWIDGALKATVANAATVTATDMLGVIVGCFGTTTTITDIDVDYILVNANRDWTV